jgi:hypothetical protein
LNAAIVVIKIVAIGGNSSIIAVTVAIPVAVSAIAAVAIIVDVALPTFSTLLCNRHCRHAPWRPIG